MQTTVPDETRSDPMCAILARMDIASILAELRSEHDQLGEAILSLEHLAAGQGKRRGRPPAWIVAAKKSYVTKRRGRPPGSKNTPKESTKA
jgi:hypothetical protein